MSLGYHINFPNEILQNLPCVQVMLQSSLYDPAKQVYNLRNYLHGYKGNIYLHWDFIYIPTRYVMFSTKIKNLILDKLKEFYKWIENDNRVKGIVFHTDYSLNRAVASNFNQQTIDKYYWKFIYDRSIIYQLSPSTVVSTSLNQFYSDCLSVIPTYKFDFAPMLLENTTKNFGDYNSLQVLVDFVKEHKYVTGLCIDTEHLYASEGKFFDSSMFIEAPMLVHLNAIPSIVEPCSHLDRHSETMLSECSKNPMEYYIQIIKECSDKHIDCIREVDYNVFLKEFGNGRCFNIID